MVGSEVYTLAASGSRVYAGGAIASVGAISRDRIAAIDLTTGEATAWNPIADQDVLALAVDGGIVYVGGSFTTIGGQSRNRIAALDATTGQVTAWNPNADGDVHALAVTGTRVYAGGAFTNINNQKNHFLVALDKTNGLPVIWPTAANGPVYSLALSASTVYAGGSYSSIGGQPRNSIAELDAGTAVATPWNPNATYFSFPASVRALALSGSLIYVGGSFDMIGGQSRICLAAIDRASGSATAWNPNPDGALYALALSGGALYAAGEFFNIGGQPRYTVAALDPATGLAFPWQMPSAPGHSLAVTSSWVFVGTTLNFMYRTPYSPLSGIGPLPSLTQIELSPIAPNPAHGPMKFEFALPRTAPVRIEVLDVMGRQIALLADQSYAPGRHHGVWNGLSKQGRAPAGLYFVRMRSEGVSLSRRVVFTY